MSALVDDMIAGLMADGSKTSITMHWGSVSFVRKPAVFTMTIKMSNIGLFRIVHLLCSGHVPNSIV
jgi:hypothetical protein